MERRPCKPWTIYKLKMTRFLPLTKRRVLPELLSGFMTDTITGLCRTMQQYTPRNEQVGERSFMIHTSVNPGIWVEIFFHIHKDSKAGRRYFSPHKMMCKTAHVSDARQTSGTLRRYRHRQTTSCPSVPHTKKFAI